jgi:transcriptional regulator with XRE-family HTH domain
MENKKAQITEKAANRIRLLRKERGLSQESLALASGLNIAYIGNIERCLKCPTIDTLNRIASALNVSLSELLYFDEPKEDAHSESLKKIEFSIKNLSDEDAMRIAEIVTEIVKLKG